MAKTTEEASLATEVELRFDAESEANNTQNELFVELVFY